MKLRQQHDQNFPMDGKPLQNKYDEMKYILFNKIYISLLQFQVISENKTLGNL